MADVHDIATRRYNMSKIKGKDTKPEVMVRKFLHTHGFRYRLHDKKLSGKPDIVLPKYNTIIMVHGCFWHGHEGCKYFVIPKTRTEWWLDKINSNKRKDTENEKQLKALGWQVLTVFECDLKPDKRELTLSQIIETLKNKDYDNRN